MRGGSWRRRKGGNGNGYRRVVDEREKRYKGLLFVVAFAFGAGGVGYLRCKMERIGRVRFMTLSVHMTERHIVL